MKRLVVMVLGLFVVMFMSGCASPGGMVYIGPVGYYASKSSDKAMMLRSTASSKLTEEKKNLVFRAVNMGTQPGEIALGVGMDVFEFLKGNYTTWEKTKQFGAAVVDSGLYGAAGWGLSSTFDNHKTYNSTYYIINNRGNGNNNNNGGSGSQSAINEHTEVAQ